jgi:hypothetical protein
MSRCSVCAHPDRDRIDAALLAGASHRVIARQFGAGHDAVQRHAASHLALKTAEANRAVERDILSEVERIIGRIDRALDRVEKAGDDRTLFLGLRERRATIELLAKLRGELDERAVVNVLALPEWLSVREVLLAALAPYPDARVAVGEAMAQLEGGSNGHGG